MLSYVPSNLFNPYPRQVPPQAALVASWESPLTRQSLPRSRVSWLPAPIDTSWPLDTGTTASSASQLSQVQYRKESVVEVLVLLYHYIAIRFPSQVVAQKTQEHLSCLDSVRDAHLRPTHTHTYTRRRQVELQISSRGWLLLIKLNRLEHIE